MVEIRSPYMFLDRISIENGISPLGIMLVIRKGSAMRKSIATLLAASMALSSIAPANASEWTNWTRMNPDSYKVTMAEMTNRCLASVALTGKGSEAECEEVATMLQANQCQFAPVPDGVRYDWMNGLKAGRPHVYTKMVKALGAPRKAYICTAASGRVYDWYVGEDGISCGNLGAREFVPPPVAYLPPPPPSSPPVIPMPTITTTITQSHGSDVPTSYGYGWFPSPTYRGGRTIVTSESGADSSSTSRSNGGCTAACTPTNPNHRP